MTSYWLLKTEPEDYAWADLVKEKEAVWDGVKAPAAIRNIQQIKPGDKVFIYHTGKEKAVIGVAKVSQGPAVIPETGAYIFSIIADAELPRPVTLREIKASGLYPDWDLVRLPRLSVVPVSSQQWRTILDWSHTPSTPV